MKSQFNKFVYFFLAFGIYIIYQARGKGQLDLIPSNVFWVVFSLMIVGLIAIPIAYKYDKKHEQNLERN